VRGYRKELGIGKESTMKLDRALSVPKEVHHELRTPLTEILGLVHYLKKCNLTLQQYDYVNSICESANHLLSTVDKLSISTNEELTEPSSDPNDQPLSPSALLVEDQPLIQLIHKKMLAELGCEVDVAGTAEQSLALIKRKKYDFIFLDLGLPDRNGIEVAAFIHQLEDRTEQGRVIVLTAYADEETKVACLKAGVEAVLLKPVKIECLEEIIYHKTD